MKTIYLFILLIGFIGASCKTAQISIQVLRPAQITLPAEIKTIAFVNRSLPDKKDKVKNVIEGIITGEAIFADRLGSEECVKGVIEGLNGSSRFKGVMPSNVNLKGTGTRQFPESLDWGTVESICKSSNADALVCLEVFDSNNSSNVSKNEVTRKENNKQVKYIEFTANLRVDVESGWKIYFPLDHKVIDQNTFNDYKTWAHTSDAARKAEQGLISKDRAVSEAGFYSGTLYADRISPRWIWVSRQYYKKGNADFEQAARLAKINNWKDAADIWRKYVDNSDPKIAGYACFNMALAAEMDGMLEEAIEWAKKAYVNYKNNIAYNYMNLLQRRLDDQHRLDEQMRVIE